MCDLPNHTACIPSVRCQAIAKPIMYAKTSQVMVKRRSLSPRRYSQRIQRFRLERDATTATHRVKAVAAVQAVVAAVGLAVVAAVGLAVVAAVVGSLGWLDGDVDGDAPKSFMCARSTGTSCSSLYGSMR